MTTTSLKPLAWPIWSSIIAVVCTGCIRYQPMPLTQTAAERALATPVVAQFQPAADKISHPLLSPIRIDLELGLTPDSAAVLAVVANPALRASRDRNALSRAQVLQAGLLPNPTLDFAFDPVTGGNTAGTVNAYNIGVSWDITALISHEAKAGAAQKADQSARLDIAWQEWQFAEAAKKAVYDILALRAQAALARTVDQNLTANLGTIQHAVDIHERTLIDLSAAEAAAVKAHADALGTERDMRQQELTLNQALGFPPTAKIRVSESVVIPSQLSLPSADDLASCVADRRLDLLALRQGYESQEQTLCAAVLSQFPKIVLGFRQASDTTNVHTTGFGVTIDLPIFDRNQGAIAIETATRQKLFDEYISRLFDTRAAIAQSLGDIRALVSQIQAAEASVPALERLVKVYAQASTERNVDALSYYTAQNDLAQKRIDVLKLKQLLMDNKILLELATGRPLPDAPVEGAR